MVLLLVSLGWTIGSLLAGQGIDRLGYRFVGITGMFLLTVGYGLFIAPSSNGEIVVVLASGTLIGIGMGFANLTTLVAAQNSVWSRRIGVATSTVMLFRTFGGAFAVSLMGTVLLNKMQQELHQMNGLSSAFLGKLAQPQNLLEPATRAELPLELLPKLVTVLSDGIWRAFATIFVLMIIGIIVSLFLGHYTPANTPRPSKKTD